MKRAMMILALVLPMAVLADSNNGQGNGQANGCGQGQGNANGLQCAGGQGGAGGAGGNAAALAGAVAGSKAVSSSVSSSVSGAAAGASVVSSQSLTGTQTVNSSPTAISSPTVNSSPVASVSVEVSSPVAPAPVARDTTTTIKAAPDVFIGGPASGPCTGVSGGASASWLGGGFGFNAATVDEGCTRRENIRVLSMILPTMKGGDAEEVRQLIMALVRKMDPKPAP